MQLAAGGDVEVHALLVGEARHGDAEEGLGRVGDATGEGGDGLAAAVAQVLLVVHEERCAELVGDVEQVAPTDREPTVVADDGVVGEQVAGKRRRHHICSGADTPSRSSPIDRPMRADSTSHRRAWVSSAGTSPMT